MIEAVVRAGLLIWLLVASGPSDPAILEAKSPCHQFDVAGVSLVREAIGCDADNPIKNHHFVAVRLVRAQATTEFDVKVAQHLGLIKV